MQNNAFYFASAHIIICIRKGQKAREMMKEIDHGDLRIEEFR